MNLTPKQQLVFDSIESSVSNHLILGKPGVGKSVLINALVEHGLKSYTVAAPTGIAAINGKTLHSLFKIPIYENGLIPPDIRLPGIDQLSHLYNIKNLIIDEISMVRCDILDYIDRVLKHFHRNSHPFGGIQVVMVGDFCQLPPVVRKEDKADLITYDYQTEFAFSAHAFKLEELKVFELTDVLRQAGDLYFMEILSAARFGNVTAPMIKSLNELCGIAREGSITLTATNAQADAINQNEMNRLQTEAKTFRAYVSGNWPQTLYPLPELINLKTGAQVMVKKNKANRPPDARGEFESRVVNGTVGKIVAFGEDEKVLVDQFTIYRQDFERTIKENVNGQWQKKVIGSFNQLPLVPAWAISMHKSQGISLDTVNIDPSKISADGQLYVALSRARTMAGITFLNDVSARKFTVNKYVKMFYESI